MKIGIDAKWFFNGPPSGRIVIRNLVENLINIKSNDELYIFLDKKEQEEIFPYQADNVHLIYLWAGNNMLSNVFVLPVRAWSLQLDIVIFQNFTPFFSNFKRYAYIHDVLFKTHPEFYTLVERLYLSPLKLLARYADRLCTVSSTEKRRMIDTGYANGDDTDIIYHGVDASFGPREQHDAEQLLKVAAKYKLPDKFILFVGRLNVRKNVFNLLKSIPLLKNKTVPLVVVGGYDWKMTSVDHLLDELKIRDRVIFTGPIYGEDLSIIYSLAKVFCFVSYAESFGLPALEGMASGVPIVVSDRTCLPEICGEAALYADPDDPQAIAQLVDNLLDDTALWHKMRRLGLARASDFTWRKSAEALLESAHKTMER